MHKIEAPGATADNKWTEGDPASGVPATQIAAVWMNAIQGELVKVIEAAGLTLKTADTETGDQLLAALQAMGLGGYATAAEAQALTSLTKLLSPGRLADAFKGDNQSLSSNGFQELPGGLILQWGETNSGVAFTFPIAFSTIPWIAGEHTGSAAIYWKLNSRSNTQFTPVSNTGAGNYVFFALGY